MIKVIDLDKLFNEYVSDFVYKNVGKMKPEEIENKVATMYNEFGDIKNDKLDGKSPNEYYKSFSVCELLECLKEHLSKKVDVPDYLISALSSLDSEKEIIRELYNENGEEYTLYLLNVLSDKDCKGVAGRLLDFIYFDYTSPVKELSTEILSKIADSVADKITEDFSSLSESVKAYAVEILSNASNKQPIYEILIEEFLRHKNQRALYADYLVKYGDVRAIKVLTEVANDPKTDYADFEELRFAIEGLGGEYTDKRDFVGDKTRDKIFGKK